MFRKLFAMVAPCVVMVSLAGCTSKMPTPDGPTPVDPCTVNPNAAGCQPPPQDRSLEFSDNISPVSGVSLAYLPFGTAPVTPIAVQIRMVLGTQTFMESKLWVCLSDKDGFYVWDSCMGYQVTPASNRAVLTPALYDSPRDRSIVSTTKVLAYWVQGSTSIQQGSADDLNPYKPETSLTLLAKAEQAWVAHWH